MHFLVPRVPPKGVRCRGLSWSSVKVDWTPLASQDLRGELQEYRIYYQHTTSRQNPTTSKGTSNTTVHCSKWALIDLKLLF